MWQVCDFQGWLIKGSTVSAWHMCALSLSFPPSPCPAFPAPLLHPSTGTVGILSYHIGSLATLWPPCWRSHRERPHRDRDAWGAPAGHILPTQALDIWPNKPARWPQSQSLSKCNLRTSSPSTSFGAAGNSSMTISGIVTMHCAADVVALTYTIHSWELNAGAALADREHENQAWVDNL